MEGEQTRIFREKLSQWIASQGFWFQLRHSLQGGGGWSMTVYHLIRIAIRCAIVLVLLVAGFGIVAFRRINSKSFQDGLNTKLVETLGVNEAVVKDFHRSGREFKIRAMAAEGNEQTFFRKLDASLIQFTPSNFLTGIVGSWDVGNIHIGQLNATVKAGTDSQDEADAAASSLFREYPGFTFSGIEVDDASFTWGYTSAERISSIFDRTTGKASPSVSRGFSTQGRIENSHLKAVRGSGSWHLEFTGGTFTQNWLEKVAIESLVVDLDDTGIRVKDASFKLEGATIGITDVVVGSGPKPKVAGKMKISRLDMRYVLAPALKEFLEGSFSGDFKIGGSLNTDEGITAEGDVQLDGRDIVSLGDRLPVFKAMGVLDNYHSYRRVEFNEGLFHLKTTADKVTISGVELKSGELMELKGDLQVRQPTREEITQSGTQSIASIGMGPEGSGDPGSDAESGRKKKKSDINLKDAASASGDKQGFDSGPDDLYERHTQERMDQEVNPEVLARLSRTLRYQGKFSLSLPPDAFDRADALKVKYPADPATKRIPMDIPISGQLGDISFELSKSLLEEGARKQ